MTGPEAIIKHAVDRTVQYINKHAMSPQDAMLKTATELELKPNFIKRASEALNVALTYNHFKKAEDRASDFPIIDAAKVARDIYDKPTETAGQVKAAHFSEYKDLDQDTPNFARYLEDGLHKQAFQQILDTVAPEKNETSVLGLLNKSANYIKKLEKAELESRVKLAGAEYKVNRNFCSILEKFARAAEYRTSFAEFEKQVLSKHGEKAAEYLDLLYTTSGLSEPRGEHDPKYQLFKDAEETVMFDKFVESTNALADAMKQAEDTAELYKFEKSYFDSIFHTDIKQAEYTESTVLSKLAADRAAIPDLEEVKDPVLACMYKRSIQEINEREEEVKKAFDILESAGNQLKSIGDTESRISSNSDKDNLHRKLMLQDLSVTDPILKTVQPQKLVEAYSQILRIAPELSTEKELTRSALRSMTAAQSLGVFEGQQMVSANNELLKQRQLLQNRNPQK